MARTPKQQSMAKPDAQVSEASRNALNAKAAANVADARAGENTTVVAGQPLAPLPIAPQNNAVNQVTLGQGTPIAHQESLSKGTALGANAPAVAQARQQAELAQRIAQGNSPIPAAAAEPAEEVKLQWYRVTNDRSIRGASGQRSKITAGTEFNQFQRNPKKLLAQGVRLEKIDEDERYSL